MRTLARSVLQYQNVTMQRKLFLHKISCWRYLSQQLNTMLDKSLQLTFVRNNTRTPHSSMHRGDQGRCEHCIGLSLKDRAQSGKSPVRLGTQPRCLTFNCAHLRRRDCTECWPGFQTNASKIF